MKRIDLLKYAMQGITREFDDLGRQAELLKDLGLEVPEQIGKRRTELNTAFRELLAEHLRLREEELGEEAAP